MLCNKAERHGDLLSQKTLFSPKRCGVLKYCSINVTIKTVPIWIKKEGKCMKKGIAILLTLFMLLPLFACSSDTEKQLSAGSSDTDIHLKGSVVYSVKINPEFEIAANDDLTVTDVMARNSDAESVLSKINIIGLKVNDAFNTLAEEAKKQGFLTEESGNTVVITILDKDEKKLPTCHLCGGCGTVKCDECHGTGILDRCVLCNGKGYFHCDVCNDTGFVPCDVCDGSGTLTKPAPDCWACHGSGVCYFCGGTGYIVVTAGDTGNVVYKADGTPETDVCVFCKGVKYCVNCMNKPCYRCNNQDNADKYPGQTVCTAHNTDFALGSKCPDCNGAGVIYCGDSFNGYNWCPCCWGSGIEGTGDPNYRDNSKK